MGRVPRRTHHLSFHHLFSLSLRLSVNRVDFPRISPPQRELCTMTPVSVTIPVPIMSVRKLPVYRALSCTRNVVIVSSVTGGLLLEENVLPERCFLARRCYQVGDLSVSNR